MSKNILLPYMRLTAIILSFLVLVLSCLPCADVESMPSIAQTHSTANKQPSQNKDTEHADLCSPFCQCACCSMFSVVHPKVVLPVTVFSVSSPIYADYLSAAEIEISLPVWQPPQLV